MHISKYGSFARQHEDLIRDLCVSISELCRAVHLEALYVNDNFWRLLGGGPKKAAHAFYEVAKECMQELARREGVEGKSLAILEVLKMLKISTDSKHPSRWIVSSHGQAIFRRVLESKFRKDQEQKEN